MDSSLFVKVLANLAVILIPLHFVTRKESSKRTKIIAVIILALLLLSLLGRLGTYLVEQDNTSQKTASTPTANELTTQCANGLLAKVGANSGVTLEDTTKFCTCKMNKYVSNYVTVEKVVELSSKSDAGFEAYDKQIEPSCLQEAGLVSNS